MAIATRPNARRLTRDSGPRGGRHRRGRTTHRRRDRRLRPRPPLLHRASPCQPLRRRRCRRRFSGRTMTIPICADRPGHAPTLPLTPTRPPGRPTDLKPRGHPTDLNRDPRGRLRSSRRTISPAPSSKRSYRLVESARVAGIDPVAYLIEVATAAKKSANAVLLPNKFKKAA